MQNRSHESSFMLQKTHCPDEIETVLALIEDEVFLKISVLDVQTYDDTLVVMTSDDVPRIFTRMLLRKVWSGPVEVYCASALMAGNNISLS